MNLKRAYSAVGGKNAIESFCAELSAEHGIRVIADPVVNEENPSDNHLCIYFEYDGSKASEFALALDEIEDFMAKRELHISYECNGDGELGIIRTYRVCDG